MPIDSEVRSYETYAEVASTRGDAAGRAVYETYAEVASSRGAAAGRAVYETYLEVMTSVTVVPPATTAFIGWGIPI